MKRLLAWATASIRHGGEREDGLGSMQGRRGGGRQWLGALPPGSKGHLLLCVIPTKRLHSKELRPTPRRRSSTRSMKMLPGKINKN